MGWGRDAGLRRTSPWLRRKDLSGRLSAEYPPAKPGALIVGRSKRPGRGRDAATGATLQVATLFQPQLLDPTILPFLLLDIRANRAKSTCMGPKTRSEQTGAEDRRSGPGKRACVPCGRNQDKRAANGATEPQADAKRRGRQSRTDGGEDRRIRPNRHELVHTAHRPYLSGWLSSF